MRSALMGFRLRDQRNVPGERRGIPGPRARWLGLLVASLLVFSGGTQAADSGPRAHAQGSFDAATGIYTVASGDDLGAIAERFGLRLSTLEQQNNLDSDLIQVGQQLDVSAARQVSTLAQGPAVAVSDLPPDPWPRKVSAGGRTLSVYQPQVESWSGNRLALRAAVATRPTEQGDEAFGVIRVQARTEVDRERRQVLLDDFSLVKADFPTIADQGEALAEDVEAMLGDALRVVALDRLEASLAAAGVTPPVGVAVNNDPPRVIVSEKPAVLIPIQGKAVFKPVSDTKLQRAINTRALILASDPSGPYFLHLLDGWMAAQSLDGPWTLAEITPGELDVVAERLAASGEVDLLHGGVTRVTLDALESGPPQVYVSEAPAELIVFNGKPNLVPIKGTDLLWADNSAADVIVDKNDGSYYVLLAGRWFRAPALTGDWTYVASIDLPEDFSRIPVESPAGVVLASVAGTTQAREALIANTIPQTVTVPLSQGPSYTLKTDGPPTVGLLKGTDLEYVVNSETPVVRVDGKTYYALHAGLWFQSDTLEGPWTLSTSIPAAIYEIPPSSPLHYLTYVQVYGADSNMIYEGYTPGYLGTVNSDDGVVVYGTGYDYQPWVGDDWITAPETYGLAAAPVYNPATGYAYGFGLGLATAASADTYWGGAYYRPNYAGYGCCAVTSANVYRHWGDTVLTGTRTWFAGDGVAGSVAHGGYVDVGTGTAGRYAADRGYDAWTGTAQRGVGRTFHTEDGTVGGVDRGERYNLYTGRRTYDSHAVALGPDGGAVSRDTVVTEKPDGQLALVHQTTVENPRTGETHEVTTARRDDDLYAGADGRVYRNTGDGWETRGETGWGPTDVGGDGFDLERQARVSADARLHASARYRGADIADSGPTDIGDDPPQREAADERLDAVSRSAQIDRVDSGGRGPTDVGGVPPERERPAPAEGAERVNAAMGERFKGGGFGARFGGVHRHR